MSNVRTRNEHARRPRSESLRGDRNRGDTFLCSRSRADSALRGRRDAELAAGAARGSRATSRACRSASQPRRSAGDRRDPGRDGLAAVRGGRAPGGSGGPGGRRARAPARARRPRRSRPPGTGGRRPAAGAGRASRPSARTSVRRGPVAVHERRRRLLADARPRGPAGRPGRRAPRAGRRPAIGELGGRARPGPGGGAQHGVDGVAGHDPVRRVLAAADADQARRLDRDPVLARHLDRRRRRPTGATSGRRPAYVPDDVVARDREVEGAVERAEDLVHLLGARRATWSSGPRYGRSVVPTIQWRGHGTRNATRPGIRSVMPPRAGIRLALDDEVAAARRQDLERARPERAVRQRAPDAGRVEDGGRADVGRRAREEVLDRWRRRHGRPRGSAPSPAPG